MRRCLRAAVTAAACLLAVPGAAAAEKSREPLRIVQLSGTPYELGRQHGALLREEVRASVAGLLRYFRGYVKVPWVGPLMVNWWLDVVWARSRPFIPPEYLEELRGLADASGVPWQELARLHAIPDRTYSCSNVAAWGRATRDGRLLHVRNLDWNIAAGIQRHAVVFVVRPEGKHAFLNLGWAGFIGVLSGVNDAQLSVGQVGAETVDATFRGVPMAFLLRRVLEEADGLAGAVSIVTGTPRTVGVNYVFADAKRREAVALETTQHYVRGFTAEDPKERRVAYAKPLADAVFRADTAMDPDIRERQLASRGDPNRPGLEPPGGSAYDVRYLGQARGLTTHYGRLDAASAQEIARAIAPDSNIQSVVFAWPEVWVANADGATPAARTTYHRLNAADLLEK